VECIQGKDRIEERRLETREKSEQDEGGDRKESSSEYRNQWRGRDKKLETRRQVDKTRCKEMRVYLFLCMVSDLRVSHATLPTPNLIQWSFT
jgi:hypothetical protein